MTSYGEGEMTEQRTPLEVLDPGSADDLYWMRFHRRVMARARAELERRRALRRAGVPDILYGWSRGIAAFAVGAAALAGVVLMEQQADFTGSTTLELQDVVTSGPTFDPFAGAPFDEEMVYPVSQVSLDSY